MYRKILFISAFISLVTVGCKKDFLDLNVDPNNPATVPASKILPAALVKTAYLTVDPNMDYPNIWMGFWSFSATYGIPTNERDYTYPSSSGRQGFFTNVYSNAYDYQQIIKLAQADHNLALQGIGRIMTAYVMQMGVDVYGDIPYTQAFQGTANQTPKYDKASDIYDSLYNQITIGINNLKAAQPADLPGVSSDIMFGGNVVKWVKFANTLKLKMLIRQAGVASKAAYIQSKIASDFNPDMSDFMQKTEIAKVNPGFTNSTNQQSPFWTNFGYSLTNTVTSGSNLDVDRGGLFAINFFGGMNDLRLSKVMDYTIYLNKNITTLNPVNGVPVDQAFYNYVEDFGVNFFFVGTEMGKAAVASSGNALPVSFSPITNNPVTSLIPVKSASSDALIFSDFESLFLQAEAVQRGWFASGDAQQLFNDGIAQSFDYDLEAPLIPALGGTGGAAAALANIIPTEDNDWATAQGAGKELQAIITQKYMALATYNFIEPWTEYRRTGFPKVDLSSAPTSGGVIPYRYLYPQREYSVNAANVPNLVSGDQFKPIGKIFWMP